jgi:hypothetical protein
MADLLDIAPSAAVDVVKIGDQRITVYLLSADALAYITTRFPGVRSLGTAGDNTAFILQLFTGFAGSIGMIIAAGCGHLGNEEYEKRAAALSFEEQLTLIEAIVDLTFPNGIGSFIERLTAVANRASGGAAKQKIVKVRLKRSPSASQLSSETVSRPSMQ